MSFQSRPIKSLEAIATSIVGYESMPWYRPTDFPTSGQQPMPLMRDYRWRVTLSVATQQHSSKDSREPGKYSGMDIYVGQWIANNNTGQAWKIIKVESKSEDRVVVIIQDIYRYNTFRDSTGQGISSPPVGIYVIFSLSQNGLPEIDPVPPSGISSQFTQNLLSRFEYNGLESHYPLFQDSNQFAVGDIVAVDPTTSNYVLSSSRYKTIVGRVTSISDTIPGWFTIDPVQKVVDNLDYLPGRIGDTIRVSESDSGQLSILGSGAPVYIKLKDSTPSITYSNSSVSTSLPAGFVLNGVDITLASADLDELIQSVNLQSALTGVVADKFVDYTIADSKFSNLSTTYGEILIHVGDSPVVASINGVPVTFDIKSTELGYEEYAQAREIAEAIRRANIPNILVESIGKQSLTLTNTASQPIVIDNRVLDINGVAFAGPNSASGLDLTTVPPDTVRARFTSVDARAIEFSRLIGTVIDDFGLTSVENGSKAAGMYIGSGLRNATATVVSTISQLESLAPMIGDTAYVIDSADDIGNNSGEWSTWIYNGSQWVKTGTEDSATVDAKSFSAFVSSTSPTVGTIGKITTGRRITSMTITTLQSFDDQASLVLRYRISNAAGQNQLGTLMESYLIDLTKPGIYESASSILFGSDTISGDVDIEYELTYGATQGGEVSIVVSYI